MTIRFNAAETTIVHHRSPEDTRRAQEFMEAFHANLDRRLLRPAANVVYATRSGIFGVNTCRNRSLQQAA